MLGTGDAIGGRYEVTAQIARGGMGSVYRVQDRKLRNKVWAMKELLNLEPGDRSFIEEVRLLSELSHPAIPKIVDLFEPDEAGRAYIVMEYIQGRNLQELYSERGWGLPLQMTLGIAVQLCEVLQYLHGLPVPVIFRDLKPANVMVDEFSRVKLIDFGIARNYKRGQLTDTVALGTLAFASPEQLENRQTGPASDLYSLGATLYYLLSGGQYYHTARHTGGVALTGSPRLNGLIRQLLEAEEGRRPSSAAAVKLMLEELLEETGTLLPEPAVKVVMDPTIQLNKLSPLRQGDASGDTIAVNKRYTLQATNATPALIIYLIDTSGSMSMEMEGRRRMDIVRDALHAAIKQMVFRSTKGSRISPRYRLAVISYSDEVHDLTGGIRSIDEFAQTGVLPELSPMGFTDTAKAFAYAERLLQEALPGMQNGPAPLICHMTDGTHTGEDPEPIVKRIMEMSVPDGNVLVENIFISDGILSEQVEHPKRWKGILQETPLESEAANRLKRMSSVLPESYREMMLDSSYSLERGALMLLPGTSAELVSLGFQMSAATPVFK